MGTVYCKKCGKIVTKQDDMTPGDYLLCKECEAAEEKPLLYAGCDPGLYTTTIAILDGFCNLQGWFQVYNSEDEYPRKPNLDRKKGQRYWDPLPDRIAEDTARFTAALLSQYSVAGIATEKMEWSAKHSDTQGWVHHNRGIIHGCCLERGVPFHMISPQQIKKAVTGNGNASKSEVVRSVYRKYGELFASYKFLSDNNHIADAIGAATLLVQQEVGYLEEDE